MQKGEASGAATPPSVLPPSGVCATAPSVDAALGEATARDGAAVEGEPSHETVSPPSIERFDRHCRLRRALAAKEATLLEITQLIMTGTTSERRVLRASKPRKATTDEAPSPALAAPTTSTADSATAKLPSALRPNEQSFAEVQPDVDNTKRLKCKELDHLKERVRLERLVYDLRRELEAAGHTLRDQTEAMKSVSMGMARMGPHRLIKAQREKKTKSLMTSEASLVEKVSHWREFNVFRERVKRLEELLAAAQCRAERAEKQCAEQQATALQQAPNKTQEDTTQVVGSGAISSVNPFTEKRGVVLTTESASCSKDEKMNYQSLMDRVREVEDAHRTARRMWSVQEREYRRHIRVLEATMSRMERQMPAEKPSKATLFNLTLRLVSCEGLFNRCNNGAGSIDPFVVVYSPSGERVFETLPREDTDCPEFSALDDIVTLKVARGSSWHIVLEVYSRGANNARLFLGQAKVPVGPLLEDVEPGGVRRHSAELKMRDRETDNEILRQARHLGAIVFDVTVAVVGCGAACGSCWRRSSSSRASPLISPGRDGEEETNAGADATKPGGSAAPLTGFTLRVAAAKGILERGPGAHSHPYVVVYDGGTGKELMRTPPVPETSEASWEGCPQASVTLPSLRRHGGIIFRVFDQDRDGRSEFLGEALLSRRQLSSGKEWHELRLAPRENEPLTHIREHHGRLGKLLVHCTRGLLSDSVGCTEKQEEHLHRQQTSTRSSRILCDEAATSDGNALLQPVKVQVHVEGCRGLLDGPGSGGDVFVRMVAPNSAAYTTSVVPRALNPSWMKKDGCATMTLHPLDSGVIGFYVMACEGQLGSKEQTLGYAQLSVGDLFLRGLGKKELELDAQPHAADTRLPPSPKTALGSILVSFALAGVSSVSTHIEKHEATVKQTAAVATAEVPNQASAPPFTASSVTSKKTEEVAAPTAVSLRIFVKEGHDLLDCDQAMFNAMGVTDPRVLVWVGPDLAFTVPEKRDTVNPVWTQEEAEFLLRVQSTQVIRFEVQDVDVAGFDSMGSANIHASEVIASPGVRSLPVMLDGTQYGTLVVLFTIDTNDHSSS
ncbi:uncharacterized protein Tco025E_06389 [Trypanosoma conorhini]|uniref:C2 domain-containing protein n=1 Tax=Trypanosoma conorhini TaxID=83891 RepID=A0A3R7MZ22_9TRYP|nr:uncharacterized protein Tco025E_06389 [Trypanosoma conorhini]RNF13427.1 hypothetical protein Tco025E_06389 [Trypanosoma conorhini]